MITTTEHIKGMSLKYVNNPLVNDIVKILKSDQLVVGKVVSIQHNYVILRFSDKTTGTYLIQYAQVVYTERED